ncbi:MAG: hypothetical protein B6D39_06775 [Anaerolineae bacterium UTCFX2]|jgi:hypothetical protein|nr:hypothetical protein [Anaerolineae bacterium]OQY91534.1 MAG: hypothetical protein B6D39_06775 [Anaerolineae bacterium UTCFX2]
MRINRLAAYLIVIFLAGSLCGCSADIVKTEQPLQSSRVIQSRAHAIGQSFTARYAGLQGFRVLADAPDSSDGAILLHLRANPPETADLRTATISLDDLSQAGEHTLRFTPLPDSAGADYFLEFETPGDSYVRLATGPAESYLHGALYVNGSPQESQLRFELVYDPWLLAGGVLKEMLRWGCWSVLALVLFVIPGWIVLHFALPGWENLLWGEKVGLASGTSLAIYPVIILWSRLAGIRPVPLIGGAAALLGVFALVWNARRLAAPGNLKTKFEWKSLLPPLYESILLGVVLLILATRFWVIRMLDAPLWGDGYQHTLITRLFVDHQGLFDSWLPYAELKTFTYHFGFHSAAALFQWISGLSVPQSVLYTGQIVNLLAVLALYPLSLRLSRNRWAALFSVTAAGLLFSLPMFYVNWSRYTQLAGQAILPAGICLIWLCLEDPDFRKRTIALTGLALSGLALTHYRVVLFALAFIPAWVFLNLRQQRLTLQIKKVFWIGVIAFLWALPWLINLFAGRLVQIAGSQLGAAPGALSDLSLTLSETTRYLSPAVWISLPLIALWGVLRRDRRFGVILLWWFFIFLASNPDLLGLPGSGLITNFTIFIAAYIPAGLLLGNGAGWLFEFLQKIRAENRPLRFWLGNYYVKFVGIGVFLAICLLGAKARLGDLEVGRHILLTRPDLRASAWIAAHLPEDARLAVNSFFAYNGAVAAGSDGGWWLPLSADRLTSQPPLNYASETGYELDFYRETNELIAAIADHGATDPSIRRMLLDRGYTHIYVGQLQGRVNSNRPLFDLDALQQDPHFLPVYHQDRVWIFAIDSP